MSVNRYEVGADIDQLNDLNIDQRTYLGYFRTIMQDIDTQARGLVEKWEGGDEKFQARATEFNNAFDMTNRGFTKMIDAVDGTVDGYQSTKKYLDGLFD
ncbi:hypothetical protein GCM10007079_22490 [Nocardiopsis terrae]|uniref:WXG100 family type VII secretion target n=1 Tax=Nocardiopsis terrae TaxID=372655 RepID=A0ABR9HGH9_9ACTN|nr:hypothetical protein [Nocardiopsis terrae]MBE1458138.1 hypothetical protein [Nocardiopsis terrae]GHC81959.1 hypothetical protein GCM10007079_22490 [Nocardiopsis terrae]